MYLGAKTFQFLTHDENNPLTFGLVIDRRDAATVVPADGLAEFVEMARAFPAACAYGKIAVVAPDGIHTFQAGARGQTIPVFCGNSTAAALVSMQQDGEIVSAVHGLAKAPYKVCASTFGGTATQSWTLPDCAIEEREWQARRVLVVRALNDYALVVGDLPSGIEPDDARREILGTALGGKLALIANRDGPPTVEFHNANGRHGAVPQTGLATIALAARHLPWLGEMFASGELVYQTRRGTRTAMLPAIVQSSCGGLQFEMPTIAVKLKALVTEPAE